MNRQMTEQADDEQISGPLTRRTQLDLNRRTGSIREFEDLQQKVPKNYVTGMLNPKTNRLMSNDTDSRANATARGLYKSNKIASRSGMRIDPGSLVPGPTFAIDAPPPIRSPKVNQPRGRTKPVIIPKREPTEEDRVEREYFLQMQAREAEEEKEKMKRVGTPKGKKLPGSTKDQSLFNKLVNYVSSFGQAPDNDEREGFRVAEEIQGLSADVNQAALARIESRLKIDDEAKEFFKREIPENLPLSREERKRLNDRENEGDRAMFLVEKMALSQRARDLIDNTKQEFNLKDQVMSRTEREMRSKAQDPNVVKAYDRIDQANRDYSGDFRSSRQFKREAEQNQVRREALQMLRDRNEREAAQARLRPDKFAKYGAMSKGEFMAERDKQIKAMTKLYESLLNQGGASELEYEAQLRQIREDLNAQVEERQIPLTRGDVTDMLDSIQRQRDMLFGGQSTRAATVLQGFLEQNDREIQQIMQDDQIPEGVNMMAIPFMDVLERQAELEAQQPINQLTQAAIDREKRTKESGATVPRQLSRRRVGLPSPAEVQQERERSKSKDKKKKK